MSMKPSKSRAKRTSVEAALAFAALFGVELLVGLPRDTAMLVGHIVIDLAASVIGAVVFEFVITNVLPKILRRAQAGMKRDRSE